MKHPQSQSQHPDKSRHIESGPTWCCCPLHSLVLCLSILLTSIYLVSIAASTVFWVLHDSSPDVTEGTVLEVNSLDELYVDVPPDESEDHFDIVVIVLLSTIVASILGCLTTILLIIGVSRKSSLLFLPWLVWHMLEILGSVASGLYLVIYFLLLIEERNVTNSILSLVPILAGIFLIFPWVLVDQLYVKYKQTSIIIEMDPGGNKLGRSLSSLSLRPGHPITRARSQSQLRTDTLRSNKSARSVKSRVSTARSVRSVKKRNDLRRHNQFHFRPEMLTRKSRSLEHILDNTSSSSSGAGSSYTELMSGAGMSGLTTLPRLRRCEEVPGMWRAAYNYTDTMRSAKSVTSIKSVQISNRVTEFHYSDSEAVDADAADYHDNINEGHDDKTDSGADHASHGPDDRLELPPPVYPTINKKNKKNTFTKDQIIDLYCASTQDLR